MVFVQIETAGALNAVAEIAAEKCVDLLFVGPNDLSQALGVPGHYDDPRYRAAVERVAAVAKENGKAAGIMLRSSDEIPALRHLATASSPRATDLWSCSRRERGACRSRGTGWN